MILQEFYIGNHDWKFCVYYDVRTAGDLDDVYEKLIHSGMSKSKATEAVKTLSRYDSGYTHTDFHRHLTLMFMGKTKSAEQMYDSIQHETKHAVEHISEYYNIDPSSEESAYLQGEIARKMFPAAAIVICPQCNRHDH